MLRGAVALRPAREEQPARLSRALRRCNRSARCWGEPLVKREESRSAPDNAGVSNDRDAPRASPATCRSLRSHGPAGPPPLPPTRSAASASKGKRDDVDPGSIRDTKTCHLGYINTS
ncbi:uncharacterized protein LOC126349156 [Schistocerca gregaria]|uniref:uncharacterized protein LOC126349156 n=1 Tax=Schistocerca gregaria TaxID=7010 RepID=UPI00211E1A77|nr:uncharacterized protein LOC126349156 [Schistocerca gregaria]